MLAIVKFAAVAATVGLASSVHAQLYGVNTDFGFGPSSVWEIDKTTGAATFKSQIQTSFSSFVGADFLNGTFYVSDVFDDGLGTWALGKVDINTGAYTRISDQDGDANYHGLAGDNANNVLYSYSLDHLRLVSVNPNSGAVTYIGGPSGDFMRGMAYDNVGKTLYALSEGTNMLCSIDTATGAVHYIGATGFADHIMVGLAHDDSTGTLYATYDVFFGGNTYGLYTIDKITGAATYVGDTGVFFLDGLGWVPSPGTLALLGLGGLAAARRRR
ncbi:MAG: hypothetical protein KIS87_09545 [Phycisphaeraceae bacterium]|nr:hypothetical protein [Phycisphaeraceae bacterium]